MLANDSVDEFARIISSYSSKYDDRLIKPAFGRGSIADLPGIFKESLGVSAGTRVPEMLRRQAEEIDHLVFFFLDGLGHSTIQHSISRFGMGNLRDFLQKSNYTPVTSVYPSTTSTATVTYQTDLQPVEHGVIGYNAYISEIGSVCNMISLAPAGRPSHSLLDNGWNIGAINRSGTIYEQLTNAEISSFLYLPRAIRNSGMTRITGQGADLNGYYSTSQMITSLRRNIENAKGKSFHFCYIPNVDTISHMIGPFGEDAAMEIESIFQVISEQFIGKIPGGKIGIIISADHGHTQIPSQNISDANSDRKLASFMRTPVVGDFRAPILRIRPHMLDEASEYITEAYGQDYIVKYSRELIRDGYFGNRGSITSDNDRFGDIVLLPLNPVGMEDTSLKVLDPGSDRHKLIGMHGGLSEEEMIVPFISRIV